MSQACQAKAKRRKMANGYAHMGGSLKRPTISGKKGRSVGEAIAAARSGAMREAARQRKKG